MYFEEASLSVHGILIRKGATVFTTEPTASLAHAAKIYGRVERTSILLASLLQAGLCVVSVLAATFTRMSPRRARGGFSSPKTASARRRDTRYSISAIRYWSFAAACGA